MVLAVTPVCVLFQSVLVTYDPYSTWSDLITLCTYLPLICLLSDRFCNLLNSVFLLFLLISMMPICLFLLLSITITFYSLFSYTNLISGRFFHLGWWWLEEFHPYCSFAITRVFMLLYIWLIFWSWLTLSILVRELCPSALLVFLGLHINFS